jgi:hypothetical protein
MLRGNVNFKDYLLRVFASLFKRKNCFDRVFVGYLGGDKEEMIGETGDGSTDPFVACSNAIY